MKLMATELAGRHTSSVYFMSNPKGRQNRSEELKTLKNRTNTLRNISWEVKPKPAAHVLSQSIMSLLRDLITLPMILLGKSKLNTKMCENYGHNAGGQVWQNGKLTCCDCGAKVTSPKELRKATLNG